ncbi:MAG: ATP-dependent DNA helicase, partial [Gammaproteobacteria bacterium]
IDTHRKAIKPVSLEAYAAFLFDHHQLLPQREQPGTDPAIDGQTQLQRSLGLLDGVAAPAAGWEQDILPARVKDYDPNWLDVMCISGRVSWGRYSLPITSLRGHARRKNATPVKSTPITLASRQNLDLWQALARAQADSKESAKPGAVAQRIEQDLKAHGASFFDQIQKRTGLLRTQLEQGLAELVSCGRICSDSYTGLRALLTPTHKKAGGSSRRGRRAMFGVEDAGRWSLLDTFEAVDDPEVSSHPDSFRHWDVLNEEQLERLIAIYLQRWGVVSRSAIDRENLAPPWRVLLLSLRKMELRGTVRGGRFIAGIGGEQFAYAETVDSLRKFGKGDVAVDGKDYFTLAATDPINLVNLILPKQ